MKKILYFLGVLALMAGFVSCDKEEGEDEVPSTGKKLKKVIDGEYYYDFVYDSEGRCTSYTDEVGETAKYTYGDGKIIEEVCLPDGEVRVTTSLTLNSDGYIKSKKVENGGAEITVYSYDKEGQLLSVTDSDEDGYSYVVNFTWENGNVTKVETHEQENGESYDLTILFEYTNSENLTPIENKVGFTMMQIEDGKYSTPYYLSGVALKNLPVEIKYMESGKEFASLNVIWTFDADGYPTKMLSEGYNENSVEFVWE